MSVLKIPVLRDSLLAVLTAAQAQRESRSDWIRFEQEQMFCAVNLERESLGKEPVSFDQVLQAERQAIGHSDYSRKFALYCAQLVLSD